MILVGFHDRINGHANRIRMLDRFLASAKSQDGVWFARKVGFPDGRSPAAKTRPS